MLLGVCTSKSHHTSILGLLLVLPVDLPERKSEILLLLYEIIRKGVRGQLIYGYMYGLRTDCGRMRVVPRIYV